jgi:hypothetical protein
VTKFFVHYSSVMSAVVYFMRLTGTDDVSRAGFGLFVWSSIVVKDCDNICTPRLVICMYICICVYI